MDRRNLLLTLPLLLGACLSDDAWDDELSARAVRDPTGASGTSNREPLDARSFFADFEATFTRLYAPFEPSFQRVRTDAEVGRLADAWGASSGDFLSGQLGPITPIPPTTPGDKWSPSEDADSSMNVCDRPPAGRPTFNECSWEERHHIETAWNHAHYGLWRALQRVHWVLDAPDDETAALRWSREAKESRSAPATWFGPFSRPRAEAVRKTLEKAWAQLSMEDEIQFSCWRLPTWWEVLFVPMKLQVAIKSPCAWNKEVLAHTIWVGHPPLNPYVDDPAYEICPGFLERDNPSEWENNYLGGVLVHEMLHFAITPNCGGFPDSTCDSVGPIPSHRNFLYNDIGQMSDKQPSDACDENKPHGKCYAISESMSLALDDANQAATSPSAYQHFVHHTAQMYREGKCLTGMNKCFPTDLEAESCIQQSCPPPAGNDCDPGTPGCDCMDVNAAYHADLMLDGGRADGSGSFLAAADDGQYCPGADVVCGTRTTSECGAQPVCQTCGEDTFVGCPCDADADCGHQGDGLKCWGGRNAGWPHAPSDSGVCLPSDGTAQGRDALEGMPWFCLENCAATEQWEGQTACVYNQSEYEFDHGTCMHMSTCESGSMHPGECEADGLVCNGDDSCAEECGKDSDCGDLLHYPGDYACVEFGDVSACIPPICAGGDALGYCGLHAPQQ